MTDKRISNILLPDLGPATGLAVLGFRAHAFGRSDCCCVQSGFRSALGDEAEEVLAELLIFTRVMGYEGRRKISLSAPGCPKMTVDEISVVCAFTAAQAWDEVALDSHLSSLLATAVPVGLKETVRRIGDIFAGHGWAFQAPAGSRRVAAAATPAFRGPMFGTGG